MSMRSPMLQYLKDTNNPKHTKVPTSIHNFQRCKRTLPVSLFFVNTARKMVSGNQIIAEIENSKIISFQIILIVEKTVTLCHEEID